jgi:hypothetical protein
MWFFYIEFQNTSICTNSFKISFWLGLFSAFIIGCGGYKFSFGLVGRRILLAKIENCALWTDRYTHTIIDWINIVFCFSAWFCFSWTNV